MSVREQGKAFPVLPTSQRKLVGMETNGNEGLFSLITRITMTTTNEMVLIDSRPTGEGSVVALRYPNKIVWKYNGHASINTESTYPFTSVGIVATDTGNIVVSDRDNHMLHILNTCGALKTSIDTELRSIHYPMCLTIDVGGFLWIGCGIPEDNEREHHKHRAMSYIVKFSGF